MARDFYHKNVREALEKDGRFGVPMDNYARPLFCKIDDVGYEIDFAAEPLIAAEKDELKIAIEVKSFVGPSTINEFHKAVGQFNDYAVALEIADPNRVLFLAIPDEVWERFFLKPIIQKSLERIKAKILVFEPTQNIIIQWIK